MDLASTSKSTCTQINYSSDPINKAPRDIQATSFECKSHIVQVNKGKVVSKSLVEKTPQIIHRKREGNNSGGDSCSSSCCCESSSFSSSASSICTSSVSSSSSRYSTSSSSTVSSVSSSTHSDSSTISDHECKSELCFDDHCNHTSDCKSASPSFCSCCETEIVTSEQLLAAVGITADGEIYDEIEDAFKPLASPCAKEDTVFPSCQGNLPSICKPNWFKQSTLSINGTQAIFYLKLLHGTHCDFNNEASNSHRVISQGALQPSINASKQVTRPDRLTHQQSSHDGSGKFSLWPLKKKSLARVMNRSSSKKNESHLSGSHGNAHSKNLKREGASESTALIKVEDSASCMSSVAGSSQANKVFADQRAIADPIKVEGKHSKSTYQSTAQHCSQSLQSPTLTTQQLLEQYPDICNQSAATFSTYQPPRPPKPLRFRPPETFVPPKTNGMNNGLEQTRCSSNAWQGKSIASSESVNDAPAVAGNCDVSLKDPLQSLCSEQCNTCKSNSESKSHNASSGKCSSIDPGQANCTHGDTLINLLNNGSCCKIDLLNEQLNTNSLMVLFMTPLNGHSSIKSSESDFIDLSRSTKSSFNASAPSSPLTTCVVEEETSTCSVNTATHSLSNSIDCARQATLPSTKSHVTPQSKASTSSPSHSHQHTGSNDNSSSLSRDCLAFTYPACCSCHCSQDNDIDNGVNRKERTKRKKSCVRDALIAKLKGMFITLCHVTSDITNQLPITCTISLDDENNSHSKQCTFDRQHYEGNQVNDTKEPIEGKTAQSKLLSTKQLTSGKQQSNYPTQGAADSGDSRAGNCPSLSLSFNKSDKMADAPRNYRVAFVHEFTSILVVAIPESIDEEIMSVTSLTMSLSQLLRFSFASLDSAFKNKQNHTIINSYLNLLCSTFLSPISLSKYVSSYNVTGATLSNVSTVLSPIMGIVQKIHFTDDELYTEISDKLSEYETKDWTQFDQDTRCKQARSVDETFSSNATCDESSENAFHLPSGLTSAPGGSPGDFLVVGSIFFQRGYLIQSHMPLYFQSDVINFVKTRGLLDLTSRHSCKLVIWQEVHPTGSNKQLIQVNMSSNNIHSSYSDASKCFEMNSPGDISMTGRAQLNDGEGETFDSMRYDASDYSAHSGRFFLLVIGIKHTLFAVLLEVPFIFSTEPLIQPNQVIILQSIRFVISSLQRSGVTDEVNDHLLLQSLAQFSHEQDISKCIGGRKKKFTAQNLLKSAKSLKDLLSFTSIDNANEACDGKTGKSLDKERQSFLTRVDETARKIATGTSYESAGGAACSPLLENQSSSGDTSKSLSSAAKGAGKLRGMKGSDKNSLKKAQSTPSLNSSGPRQMISPTNGNTLFTSQLAGSSRSSTNQMMHTSTSNLSDVTSTCNSTFSCKSLALEYRERLSSLLPRNVLLFTDVDLKEATFTSSILAPLMEEQNLSLKLADLSHFTKKNRCKMNHRLSYLILTQYRQAMITLNSYLNQMPLMKECGISFTLDRSTCKQMAKDHKLFCADVRDKEEAQECEYHNASDCHRKEKMISSERNNNKNERKSNGDSESNPRDLLSHQMHSSNSTQGFIDARKSERSNKYIKCEDSTSNTLQDEYSVRSPVNHSQTSLLSPAVTNNCSKGDDKLLDDKLIRDTAYDRAIYWVCAYKKSPVRTLFTCSISPKVSGHKATTHNTAATNVSNLSPLHTKNGYQHPMANNSSNKPFVINSSDIRDSKHLDSHLMSMHSIAYSLALADKDC